MDLNEIVQKRIVYEIHGMEQANVKHDITYQTVGDIDLKCDVYYPPEFNGQTKLPAVLLVHGDVDPGILAPEVLNHAKDWGGYISTSQLVAACGLIAIPFNHRSAEGRISKMWDVSDDIQAMVNFVHAHADELMIDQNAIGIWAWSDGVPYLSTLLEAKPEFLRCCVAYYGVMDLQQFIPTLPATLTETQRETIIHTLKSFSVINLLMGKSQAIPPMLIVKAGLDDPRINDSIDEFMSKAQTQGVAVELEDHPEGHHGFDSVDEQEKSREIIKATLDFLKKHLVGSQR
jgi:acetyl esterase/lipase